MLVWTTTLYKNWNKDRVASRAAALAYYTIFSLAPILLISISLAGTFFGEEEAKGQLLAQMRGLLGNEVAFQIQGIINNAHPAASALYTRIISIFILIFSASGVFSEIQEGLNTIWKVKSDPKQGWVYLVKRRLLSFAMVLVFAFLLLVSLIISTVLSFLSTYINYFNGNNILIELFMSDIVSFFIITILFAMIFKYLPDVKLPWRSVWTGALVTSLLFSLGKIGIGLYLHKVHIASVFGAAGFLIVILIWVYYSAQIFFIGAEITKINSEKENL